ncbi:MAG: GxGYxYP domain-containing protein [Planctomycetota bacterium]
MRGRNFGGRCRRQFPVLIFVALASLLFCSPYAFAAVPDTIYVYDMTGTTPEDIMMSGLIGVVAKTSPEVYLSWSTPSAPKFWLDELQSKRPDVTLEWHSDPAWFLNKYKSNFNGYILYDSDSLNPATSLAGIHSALMVDTSTESYATAAGLAMIADVRGKDDDWVYANYGSQLNKDILINQGPATHHLRDYAIYKNAFTSLNASETYYANQNDHSLVMGAWPGQSESSFFTKCSQNNLMVAASDWLENASVTSQWTMPIAEQSTHTSPSTPTTEGKHYVSFVMSDGDNVQWLAGDFFNEEWFGSPYRGNFDMTWDFNPTLAEVSPLAFNYYYENASTGENKDFFVTASGPGVMYPHAYPDIEGFVDVNAAAMANADQNVISVIDTSWNTDDLDVILEDPGIIGMMFKTYAGAYKEMEGYIYWHDGKPCVTVKYSLWDGYDTEDEIITALNSAVTDPAYDQNSYTVINVHPWSTGAFGDPMSSINYIVQNLGENVEVVCLDELIIHLTQNSDTLLTDSTVWAAGTADWHTSGNWDSALPTTKFYTTIDNGGTAQISLAAEAGLLRIGQNSTGSVEQTGGSLTAGWKIHLGENNGSSGTYTLNDGALSTGLLYVGHGGTGEFNQEGGTVTISDSLHIAYDVLFCEGTYNLNGGELNTVDLYLGDNRGRGTFNQTDGALSVSGTLDISSPLLNLRGIYSLGGGSLDVHDLSLAGVGILNITSSDVYIEISGSLALQENAVFMAVPGTTIHMTGSDFENTSTSLTNLGWLQNTTFAYENSSDTDTFEIASYDYGLIEDNFYGNFGLAGLILDGSYSGTLQLVDAHVNFTGAGPSTQSEALYVRTLVLGAHATLDLNGYNLYVMDFTSYGGDVLNGEIQALSSAYIPEPGTLLLLAPALLGLAGLLRKKFRSS